MTAEGLPDSARLDSGEEWKWIGSKWISSNLTIDIEHRGDKGQWEKATLREWVGVGKEGDPAFKIRQEEFVYQSEGRVDPDHVDTQYCPHPEVHSLGNDPCQWCGRSSPEEEVNVIRLDSSEGWEADAQRYAINAHFWREKAEALEKTTGLDKWNCQYCNKPLDATHPTGIYECPNCLKNFPNTESVADILREREELKKELAGTDRMVKLHDDGTWTRLKKTE